MDTAAYPNRSICDIWTGKTAFPAADAAATSYADKARQMDSGFGHIAAGYTLDFLPNRLYNDLAIIAPYDRRSQNKKGVFVMKKAEFWKGFGVGFTVLLLLMCLCMTAFASSKRTIDVEDGIGISINGATFIPRDAAGNQVSVFIYNGTTYAPVRAIGEAMGLDVKFDSANRMVQLTTQDRLLAQSGTSGSYISADRAKEIALADAGLKEGNAVFLKVKLERDDGRYQYDVEFYSGTTEYDYEIDAVRHPAPI